MIVSQISELKQAGVWKNFSGSANVKLEQRTLIYGFNGTGKTVLSRVFSSIQQERLEDRLPPETIFKIKMSNNALITQTDISNPFGKNLLIFNTDFVSRNFLWDDSSSEGIVYLNEKNINDKQELDEVNKQLPIVQKQVDGQEKANKNAEDAFKKFKAQVAVHVREKVLLNTYTHGYNARNIGNHYSKTSFNANKKLSENDFRNYQEALNQSEIPPHPNFSLRLPDDLANWFKDSQSLLTQNISSIAQEIFESHSESLRWVEKGLHYHDEHKLMECLLCGNPFLEERRDLLRTLFDESWDEVTNTLKNSIEHGQKHLQALRNIYKSIPEERQIIAQERESFAHNRESIITAITQIGSCIKEILEGLKSRVNNPTKEVVVNRDLENFNFDIWLSEYANIKIALETIVDKHNEASRNFKAMQDDAFAKIEGHILATHQEEWNSHQNNMANIAEEMESAQRKNSTLLKRQRELHGNMQDHSIGVNRINRLISLYLGHKEIHFVAQNNGYKILRSNEIPAKDLSEGERMAISFCYFLTQLNADGRQIEDLILVIDDPISSLDSTAQTHAYSLMTQMTKKCAQVIVLTHNMKFMNMVKGGFNALQNRDWTKAFLSLDCRGSGSEDGNDRSTVLIPMPELLVKHDSEYHYLFSLVYEAAKTGITEKLFLLPNATRKLLEMFTAFCSPGKITFVEALMEHQNTVQDKIDIRALERLVQIESHGDIDGFSSLPDLTMEESIRAAKAAIDFIKEVSKDHHDKMRRVCERNQSQ